MRKLLNPRGELWQVCVHSGRSGVDEMFRPWRWYVGSLSRRPLLIQACSTGVISGVGDVIAQQWVEGGTPSSHNWSRTLRFSSVGFLFVGPVLGRWFARLDKMVGSQQTLTGGLKKMVIDQACFVPVFFAALLPILSFSQGIPPRGIPQKLKQDYPSVLWANYTIWPAVQLLNFSLVPLHLRVNVANLVAVGWNCYLSWRSHQPSHDQSHDPPRVT